MPTIHALLVAINEYPNPAHCLNGCVNDLLQVKDCLQQCCTALGYGFDPLVLTNEQATRANIIAGFDHFETAAPDDPCLFYYAGHGARSAAPEAFWHLEPDHKNDSIVCYDSRTPGGRDLMDKELSYLVWRASQSKNLPFITITDCCHSGSLRDLGGHTVAAVRQIRETGAGLEEGEYLGIEHYKRSDKGELSPPQGRRVHLAAARDVETAKEVRVGTDTKGIFSHFLVETLRQTGPFVSYSDLLSRVHLRVRGNITDQSPQIWATDAPDKDLAFLSGHLSSGKKSYLISFDKNTGWQLNAGTIHGLYSEKDGEKTLLEVPELRRIVEIKEAFPTCSHITGMQEDDERRTYSAFISQRPVPKIRIAFAPGYEPSAGDTLAKLLSAKGSDLFCLTARNAEADFLIHARDTALWLSLPYNDLPLFQPVQGYDESAALLFLNQTEVVAAWQQRLILEHPDSSIEAGETEIQLYRITEPGNMEDTALSELVNLQNMPIRFEYSMIDGVAYQPAFQFRVRNNGHRALWFSLLYFGCDYSISNVLLPQQMLSPGEEVWASDIVDSYPYRTIPLQIDDNYQTQGVKSILEYLKLIICTEALNTDLLCQEGLKSDDGAHRQLCLRKKPTQRDWKCVTLEIKISQ